MTKDKKREPLFHISKRMAIPACQGWLIRISAGVIALLVCSLIAAIFTKDFGGFFKSMGSGAFGTSIRSWTLVEDLAILLCIALALTPAFKMKFWNIGGEGQTLISCLVCAVCMYYIRGNIPNALLVLICLVGGIGAGMLWAVIPALFKSKWNTNETLFTLMMNYFAMCLVAFFISYAVRSGSGVLGFLNYGHLPTLAIPGLPPTGQKYLLSILLVAILTVIIYIYLRFSKHGYEISVVGESVNTARYIGINVKKVIIRTMLLSGAICGFAGWLLVTGARFTVNANLVNGDGFTAILVAWLAKFNPLAMVLTAFLVTFLKKGASQVVTDYKLGQDYFGDVITGIFIFFIIGCEFFINYRIQFKRRSKSGPVEAEHLPDSSEEHETAAPAPQTETVEEGE